MKTDYWKLVAGAVGWLRYKQRCMLVCTERSPFNSWIYRPDVIGITRQRQVVEIEVKTSVADFKANGEKRGIVLRKKGLAFDYPIRFYFIVPRSIVEQVIPLLDEADGLLTLAEKERWGFDVEFIKKAETDHRAQKLSILQISRMVMHQTATLHRAFRKIADLSCSENLAVNIQ